MRDRDNRPPGLNWLKNKIAKALNKLAKQRPWKKPAPSPSAPPSEPPAGGAGRVQGTLYRIKSDTELAEYNFMSRTASPEWKGHQMTPATCRINGGKSALRISDRAQRLVEALNKPHGTLAYVTNTGGGWVNGGEWPLVQQLTFVSFVENGKWLNLVDVLRIEGRKAFIRTWHGETNDPYVIHRWVNIQRDGSLLGTQNPKGDGIGYIVFEYPGDVWIDINRLEKVE
jgi:hypothetical protein